MMKIAHCAIRPFLTVLIAFAALALVALRPAAATPQIRVKEVTFPVTLSDGNTYSIAGHLYYQRSYRNKTLQVAIHGATYNHRYWDAPRVNGHPYSYARFMARLNYAVLAIDQIGSGESSRPAGDLVTLEQAGSGVHQVLASLRGAHNPLGHAFDEIVLVGHSLGSITATYVQGAYGDADALVTTGMGHVPVPSPFDPAELAVLLQEPYFTLPPEARAALFYNPLLTDPDVLARDVELLDELPRGLATSVLPFQYDPAVTLVDQVTSPVLVQLGELDPIAPGSTADLEDDAWTSASDVTVQVLPGMGHNANLHVHNLVSWIPIHGWIAATLGWP
ncbi:alpha/beta hydrolase [Sorangium sp. So ce1078]|uniref:alpha/beta hydrolase n=1 Tax=Sorangium sp. So ce1078 TaxID=3133329 RepID=UPI003F641788